MSHASGSTSISTPSAISGRGASESGRAVEARSSAGSPPAGVGAAVAAAAKIACRMTPVPAITLTLSHETRDRAEVRITEERAPGAAPAAGAWEIRFTVERDEPAEVWTLAETH